MIKCPMVCVAERVLESKETNNLSIIEVLDAIQAPQFPAVLPKVHIAFVLTREAGDPERKPMQLKCSMGATSIVDQQVEVIFGANPKTRFQAALLQFPVPGPGTLRFELFDEGQAIATWVIDVAQTAKTVN